MDVCERLILSLLDRNALRFGHCAGFHDLQGVGAPLNTRQVAFGNDHPIAVHHHAALFQHLDEITIELGMVGTNAAQGDRVHPSVQIDPAARLEVACPRCGATATEKVSQFGSTPCKASYRCTDCLEPFDYFKCI